MEAAFFSLLRAGLWGKPADAALFLRLPMEKWTELYHLVCTQALLGVTFDGLQTLPQEARPPRPLYLQWAARAAQIEQANRQLNGMVARLQELYTGIGLHPVLLKGQGIATNYREPLHRQYGDIDIMLGKEGQPLANGLLLSLGAKVSGEASNIHASYDWEGCHIENHRNMLRMNNPMAHRRFLRLLDEWYPHHADTAPGIAMPVPPATFNVLYIFLHAFKHFLNSGVGLRQLCDWTCLLHARRQEIDGALLTQWLKELHVQPAARAFGYLAVTRLGLPAEELPFSIEGSEKLGEALLQEIYATGNFGQHDARIKPRPKGYWAGKWHTFCRATRRCNSLRHFAPLEAFWYPVKLIRGTISIQWIRLKRFLKLTP